MIAGLIIVGFLAIVIGILLLYLGIGGQVSASTEFGDYSGAVGAVALILGIVLMALGVLL